MNVSFETPDDHRNEIYDRYAEFRPQYSASTTARGLVEGKAAVFRKLFLPLLPARKDAPILDIGCGCGELVYFLQCEGYSNARGIDLNEQQVRVGKMLGVLNLRCGDGRKFLSEAKQSFDFISAVDVLEHIPKGQVPGFLRLIHAALSPGGTFLCQVPNLAGFYNPLFYMDFTHETPFTASSLRQVLQLAGFADVKVRPMGPVVHGLKSAVRFLLWKGINAGLRFIQTVEGGPRASSDSIYTAEIYASAQRPRR